MFSLRIKIRNTEEGVLVVGRFFKKNYDLRNREEVLRNSKYLYDIIDSIIFSSIKYDKKCKYEKLNKYEVYYHAIMTYIIDLINEDNSIMNDNNINGMYKNYLNNCKYSLFRCRYVTN